MLSTLPTLNNAVLDSFLRILPFASYYSTARFRYCSMGFNIALGDTDNESASKGNEFGLRHEMWFNGTHNASIPGNQHTFLSEFGRLWLMPGPKPAEI
jgi:hypothetical protein